MKTRATRKDPFAACPVHAPYVEAREIDGKVQVRLQPPPSAGRGWWASLTFRLTMFPFRLVCLDELGTFYWKQVDGRRTLADIERRLRDHARMEPGQSRDAVVVFTKMLMRRSLIALKLPGHAEAARAGVRP